MERQVVHKFLIEKEYGKGTFCHDILYIHKINDLFVYVILKGTHTI